jgi:DNA polymerase III subunit delta
MLITPQQLNQQLKIATNKLFVIAGNEPLCNMQCLDAIRQNARQQGAEERIHFTVERNFNWQVIKNFNQSISLFSTHRILEISIPNGKPGHDGAAALTELANQATIDTTIIICLPTLEREAKNSIWYGALLKSGIIIDVKDIPLDKLPNWISQQLTLQKQSTDSASLAFIAQQVEGNLLAAHQEIQKLALLYPEGEISSDKIKAAVLNVARFDAFQLGEAMLEGDALRTARILQGLIDEGEQPISIMNPLLWLLRPLLRLKLAQSKGDNLNQAMTSARIFGDRQLLMKQALNRLSLRQLEAAMIKMTEVDKIAKGVMLGDAWLEISRLCFGLASIKLKSR